MKIRLSQTELSDIDKSIQETDVMELRETIEDIIEQNETSEKVRIQIQDLISKLKYNKPSEKIRLLKIIIGEVLYELQKYEI